MALDGCRFESCQGNVTHATLTTRGVAGKVVTTRERKHSLLKGARKMFTMDNLKVEFETRGRDSAIWEKVTVSDGRTYLIGSCDLSDGKVEEADPETQLLWLLGALPEKETWVMEAKVLPDGSWEIANPCGEQCKEGVCNKRLASSREVASQEHGYKMLLDALNA
jgi:hypothetical protein